MASKAVGRIYIGVSLPKDENDYFCGNNSNITINVPESLNNLSSEQVRDLIANAILEVK